MGDQKANRVIAQRLKPGVDFRKTLEQIVELERIRAGVLLSVVGSLSSAALRTPAGTHIILSEPLELVSGTGTVGSGGIHVHVSVSDENGVTFGGHLLEGCVIRTTLELTILDLSANMVFDRVIDERTGYKELVVNYL